MAEQARFPGAGGGEGAEESEPELGALPLDATAAAEALHLAHREPSLASRIGAYFERQTRLVATQTEHMHEQRALQISLLKIKRLGERLKLLTQSLFAATSLLIVIYLLMMFYDALTSRAVIVEPFDAPPALAESGITGTVIASALLDQLVRLQSAAQSSAAKRELSSGWTTEVKVEVPETGISLGEIDRLLKKRFSHDLHISGDLVETAGGGLELTLRGDSMIARTFSGTVADRAKLTTEAAEYVYGQTQPALFAIYLLRAGRNSEAIAFCKAAMVTASSAEQPVLLNTWASAIANIGGPIQEALSLEEAAIARKPDYWTAYGNALLDARILGHEEQAWHFGKQMLDKAGGRNGRASPASFIPWDFLTSNLIAERAELLADAQAHAGIGSTDNAANPVIAGIDADLHDEEDLKIRLATLDMNDPYARALLHYIHARQAEDRGDTVTAAQEMEAYGAANADPAISGGDPSYHCAVGYAEANAGNRQKAAAEFAAGGSFVDCLRYQAALVEQSGDRVAAERIYQSAVDLAPDLPQAYLSWAEARLRAGDLAGAAANFAQAHQRGPGWADPLREWGDLLARQGKWRQALEKYDAALRNAPAWQALRQARAAAASHAG